MINSLLTLDNEFNSIDELNKWIVERNEAVKVDVEQIKLKCLEKWHFDDGGNLRHDSGKFFSIEGIHVDTDYGNVPSWDQPIINQPEVGFLGILCKEFNGTLYFLMQAKIEPGNVNCVQISPTIQATKSNYTGVHKGKKPAYLEYFQKALPHQMILDQLQSEQGARFLRKRNRNLIVKVEGDIEVLPDFRWMTLGQIKSMIHSDNKVNMDTRTVISGIDFTKYITPLTNFENLSDFGRDMLSSAKRHSGICTMDENLSWLSNLKSKYDLVVKTMPLNQVNDWTIKDYEISRDDDNFFKIAGVNVTISNREVATWCQPIVMPMRQGICAFIIKKINGVPHFLVQAKLECGNFDVLELAPTVQCLTGKYMESKNKMPFLEYVLNASNNEVIYDVLQSEEGGRFYHEQNRNMLLYVGDEFPTEVPSNYHWMTLGQMFEFLRFNNFLNIQSRSLISAIRFN